MKKLTKKSLDDLALVMPVINETEQREFVGGLKITPIKINGGYLISYDYESDVLGKLTVYEPDNGGASIVFDGVVCSSGSLGGCAYQFNGIKVGPNPETNFDISTMIHEYGHFLQQESIGFSPAYLVYAGIGSAIGNIYQYFGGNYYSVYSEKDASERGQAYMNQYYPNGGYTAEGL